MSYRTGMLLHTAQTVWISTGDPYPVRGDVYTPEPGPPNAIVVLAPGFKGHRKWGFFPYLATRLCAAGMAVLSIDFSLNGTVSGDGDAMPDETPAPDTHRYTRPDLFARNTLRREFDDIGAVIRHIRAGNLPGGVGRALPLGLYGHSRGGVAVILNALEPRKVDALCTWSTTDDPDFFTDRQKREWREKGVMEFVDARDGTTLGVNIDYLDDLEQNHEFYALGKRVASLRVPHLIVHGTLDMVVKVDAALALHDAERRLEDRGLALFETGHTFGILYPSSGDTAPSSVLEHAAAESVGWFRAHLSPEGA